MSVTKSDADVLSTPIEVGDIEGGSAQHSEKNGTTADERDMWRLGKVQETKRNFSFVTIFGFSMVLLSTWEAQLSTAVFGLLNGGQAGMVYMYLVAMAGFGFIIASLAEMASMAPTSGGQYHWVSEFAPRSAQKVLSYAVGWLSVLGWQTGCAAVTFLIGTQIQGLIVLNYPDTYVYQHWHGTLLAYAVGLFAVIVNTFLSRKLPLLEGIVLVLHVMGFFAILTPLIVMGDRASAKAVFTEFSDFGGWGSTGLACLVGLTGPISTFVGSDAAAHMSEEIRDASRVLPRAMFWTWLGNGIFGFLSLLTIVFVVGDLEEVLGTPTGYPFIQIFYNSTGSVGAATGMVVILLVIGIFALVGNVASCSRQLFAFARDRGVPFSGFFAQISPRFGIPLNAVALTVTVSLLLSLINIGSSLAFNIILSLGVGAMLSSYLISISCILAKRLRGEPLLPSKFSLGRFGLLINLIAVLFLVLSLVLAFFPQVPNPQAETMNWAVVVYGSVLIFSFVYFIVKGRHEYDGPVEYVRKSA